MHLFGREFGIGIGIEQCLFLILKAKVCVSHQFCWLIEMNSRFGTCHVGKTVEILHSLHRKIPSSCFHQFLQFFSFAQTQQSELFEI